MKKYLIGVICLTFLSGLPACDSGSNGQANGTTETAADSTLTEERQELLAYTSRHMMLQKELASLAQQRAQTDSLKRYAQDLNNWATIKLNELKDLEQQYSLSLPQQLTEDEQEYLEKPRETEADKFDAELWDNLVKAQKDAIKHIDDNSKDIEQTDATAFAIWERNTLKELRARMEQAAAYELELKNRSDRGGISKPIVEDINN
ncbi:putative membrane protein [Pontibacter aydingkolensis]|uniref:DUF4142 domain-containing protein n=1 Tax=Pontibacter aydingkolensis TaxID=1911536 RepID=A0ABS7CRC4_9BACT|nr:DUF4142 domain-containing protein [Pontibacter aydingkolensis]MBW7466385.1 DUF4142 domain-containing protein [Pontibacter aydingkolensis]